MDQSSGPGRSAAAEDAKRKRTEISEEATKSEDLANKRRKDEEKLEEAPSSSAESKNPVDSDEKEAIRKAKKEENLRRKQEDPTRNPELYKWQPRAPVHQEAAKNELYLSSASNFLVQCKRVVDMLENQGFQEVKIHGLGKAFDRVQEMAKRVKDESYGLFDIEIIRSTKELIDDFEPLQPDLPPITKSRKEKCITARVFKVKDGLPDPSILKRAVQRKRSAKF